MSRTKHTIESDKRYGLWTTISKIPASKTTVEKWVCVCDCGTVGEVRKSHLYNMESTSCGCVGRAKITLRNTKHGKAGTKENNTWSRIKMRCYNENSPDYPDYGAVGITMSDAWRESFTTFFEDMGEAPKDGQRWSIGRLDNSLGYCKENCRWELDSQQARNKTKLVTNKSGTTGVHFYPKTRNGRVYTSWVATWRDLKGSCKTKSFSTNKFGEAGARELAENYRREMILELNSLGAGYSTKHGL